MPLQLQDSLKRQPSILFPPHAADFVTGRRFQGIKHSLRFPSGFVMQPAQKCKIYTNQQTGCLSFQETDSAVWNNNHDRAYLKDLRGQVVASRGAIRV